MSFNRRHFVTHTTAAGLSLMAAPAIHAARQRTFRTALIGSGWWGMNILREALAAGRCEVVGISDVDQDQLELAAEEVSELTNQQPDTYVDYRDLLDRQKPEVVIVATPDHWHALNTIHALQSGAHVFVEKPTGHTVGESQAMLRHAREADRIVQVGLHRRIGPHHVSGMRFLKEGGAGKIGMVRMFAHNRGGPEAPTANAEPPETLDWNLYCGPAPMRPFNRKIHPGGFRNFLDFANGTLGDWGVHWLDQMLWWAEEKYPHTIYSTGGRPIKGPAVLNANEQTTDAPDSQVATYEFDSFTAVWEHRRFAGNTAEKASVGCYFYGTKGTFHMGWRDGWTFYPANGREAVVHQEAELQEPDGHSIQLLWQDFMKAIDDRRQPVADIELAHRSTNLSLLGMLSLELGRSIQWDGEREQVVDDAEANQLLKRPYREPWEYPA